MAQYNPKVKLEKATGDAGPRLTLQPKAKPTQRPAARKANAPVPEAARQRAPAQVVIDVDDMDSAEEVTSCADSLPTDT